jgi:hypothetical protein
METEMYEKDMDVDSKNIDANDWEDPMEERPMTFVINN